MWKYIEQLFHFNNFYGDCDFFQTYVIISPWESESSTDFIIALIYSIYLDFLILYFSKFLIVFVILMFIYLDSIEKLI